MYKIILRLLVLVFLFISIQNAYTQERKWIMYYENDTSRYFYDSLTIHPHGGIIYVWEMGERVYEGWRGYGKGVLYHISRLRLDCNNARYSIVSSTIYHDDGTTTTNSEMSQYFSVQPNSSSWKLFNLICKNKSQ